MTRFILFLFLVLAAARFFWRLVETIVRSASAGAAAPGARSGGGPPSVKMQPCPVCGSPAQRIVHAENECNYCARCQTGGRLLADRALSRLLHKSWPRSIDELG